MYQLNLPNIFTQLIKTQNHFCLFATPPQKKSCNLCSELCYLSQRDMYYLTTDTNRMCSCICWSGISVAHLAAKQYRFPGNNICSSYTTAGSSWGYLKLITKLQLKQLTMTFIIMHRMQVCIAASGLVLHSAKAMHHSVQLKIGMLICVLTGMLFGTAYYLTVNSPGKYSQYFHYPSVPRS
jgi:hypothetical protein